ncbi:hypothetical protein J422_02045 [Methanocaldococcus villosus KIN24-T80]|uniref:Uncharacterized protein n=1 Tax=Methanocaldococcus villosus KIN24-T80 TaxID=1069083 RepID=N6VZM6_9EURY|nr:DUF3343 domain-containing protein [Methanocaldococcus villosus]ENN96552.1 hypothetical protein J422_02045 [Methanocaldococcus villosus KIN24-T80]
MILKKIKKLLRKKGNEEKEFEGRGLIIFKSVKDAMKAESILKNYNVRVVAPPYEIREGCDLALEYDLVDELGIKRELEKNNINPLKFIPLNDYSLKPLELIKIKEIDGFIMVRCGNMKITIDKEGNIVNISGGGCPDVPYLALKLKGKNIKDIKEDETPKSLGYTLCAYTLNKAFEKAKELINLKNKF